MHRRTAGILAVALVVAACSSNSRPESSRVAPGDCPADLDAALEAWGEVGFDGTIAIVRGEVSCVAAAGQRDPEEGTAMSADTAFAIGSVSKSFTAAAIMRLISDGALSVDDTAGDVIPGLGGPAGDATIEQLLTHTSGVLGDAGPDHRPLSEADAIAAISQLPRSFPPGTDFGYTNAGYTLLALVIEQLTGDYRGYVAREVLPVGGQATGAGFWDGEPAVRGPRAIGYTDAGRTHEMRDFDGPHWATSGNGDLAMSTPTLAAWTSALFTGDLLPPAVVDEITMPRWDHGGGASETYGWVRYDESALGVDGFASAGGGGDTGHNAITAFLPDTETAIAIASSTPEVTAEQLMEQVIAALVAGEPIPHPQAAGGALPDPATIQRVAGTYSGEDGGQLVVAGGASGLTVEAIGAPAVDALFSLPEGFTADDVAAHEAALVELLTGAGPAGAEERAALQEAVGVARDITLQGTIVDDDELRTYVTVTGDDGALDLWYSLTDLGAVAAAEGPTDPPSADLLEWPDGTFRAADPTGKRSDTTLTFGPDAVTVDDGTTTTTFRKVS
jgi:CubicO group peptidase (beta-lactamase class C family)